MNLFAKRIDNGRTEDSGWIGTPIIETDGDSRGNADQHQGGDHAPRGQRSPD